MDGGPSRYGLPVRRLRLHPGANASSSGDGASPSRSPQPRLELAFILNESESDHTSRRPSLAPQFIRGDTANERGTPQMRTSPLPVELWRPALPMDTTSERRQRPSSGLLEETKEGVRRSPAFEADEEKTESVASTQDISARTLQERAVANASPSALSRDEKRRGRTCRADGCDKYIVNKGLCCRHGGARKCTMEGCESTAKYMGLCWKHGGSTWCKVNGCSKRAKAKGKCWAHGGGTQCRHDECTKVSVSHGLCWAHGGGKRCLVDDCNRPGYERTNGFCDRHFDELQGTNYFEV